MIFNSLDIKIFILSDIDLSFPITEDFLEVLIAEKDSCHLEYHTLVKARKSVLDDSKQKNGPFSRSYNVAILMFDSQSAANFQRRLKKSFAYLNEDKHTVILQGHTINGDGTTAQLSAILVGNTEENLPEARRGHAGSGSVDRWPFIFKKFSDQGYVTMFSEDDSMYAAFNYRLEGFRNQPTDHYTRPFWLKVKDYMYDDRCLGGKASHEIGLNYTLDFYKEYKSSGKFSITCFSYLFHHNMNGVATADDSLVNFLQEFQRQGYGNDTILILLGDHGMRVSKFRDTVQGKLEERLPFMSISLPQSLIRDHPQIYDALLHNSRLLTTHFDTHATLYHILHYPVRPSVEIGQSLFSKINPSIRTCSSAGIKDHWCPCLQFSDVNVEDDNVIKGAMFIVKFINDKIIGKYPEARSKCSRLKLSKIKRAGIQLPGEAVQTFQSSYKDNTCDECGVSKSTKKLQYPKVQTYEIVFSVEPSKGIFEAIATNDGSNWTIAKDISRLNLYGDQPKCIQDKNPELRLFCYCTI